MLSSTWMIMKIGSYLISLLGGFLYYYFVHPLSNERKKQQLNKLTSIVINFIFYIWISKILFSMSIFIKDPVAVLAYPVHSSAIYLAFLFMGINLLYRKKKAGENVKDTVAVFVPVFICASFVYEFIEIVGKDNTYKWLYLMLLTGLLFVYLIFIGRIKESTLIIFVSMGWTIGQIVAHFIGHSAFFFSYRVSPLFLFSLLFIILIWLIIERAESRRDGFDENR